MLDALSASFEAGGWIVVGIIPRFTTGYFLLMVIMLSVSIPIKVLPYGVNRQSQLPRAFWLVQDNSKASKHTDRQGDINQ